MLFMNIGMTIYVGTKPLETRWLNTMHFIEEIVIEACCVLILAFTSVDFTESAKLMYGWLMIIAMSIHFMIVCIWILWISVDFMRILYLKWGVTLKVWAVRKFGFRIGKGLKNYFNIETGDRAAPQLMLLVENKETVNLKDEIMSQIDKDDPKNKKMVTMLSHLPHIIEKNKPNYVIKLSHKMKKPAEDAISEENSSREEDSSRKED
jgi:hypothetical protein